MLNNAKDLTESSRTENEWGVSLSFLHLSGWHLQPDWKQSPINKKEQRYGLQTTFGYFYGYLYLQIVVFIVIISYKYV